MLVVYPTPTTPSFKKKFSNGVFGILNEGEGVVYTSTVKKYEKDNEKWEKSHFLSETNHIHSKNNSHRNISLLLFEVVTRR